ncbi:hypothetical protein VI817_010448 [Penicillium citrinum]|nr:hypothetical protein VI817_010448 [Penicillium citrinum]
MTTLTNTISCSYGSPGAYEDFCLKSITVNNDYAVQHAIYFVANDTGGRHLSPVGAAWEI